MNAVEEAETIIRERWEATETRCPNCDVKTSLLKYCDGCDESVCLYCWREHNDDSPIELDDGTALLVSYQDRSAFGERLYAELMAPGGLCCHPCLHSTIYAGVQTCCQCYALLGGKG